jgi:hypothetical protein
MRITEGDALRFPVQNRSPISILVVLLSGLSAIYFIPFLVPVHERFSDSYVFGYSNGTAELLLVTFTVGFAVWTHGLGLRLPTAWARTGDQFRSSAGLAIALSAFLCVLVWSVEWAIRPIWEAQYFIDRYAMFSMGGRLYKDFNFDYGPLMFYSSVWLARLCHFSLGNAYFLGWVLQWALGIWVLWKIVEVAARGTRHGRSIFLLLWVAFIPGIFDSGMNYTPLRFCAILAFALGIHFLYTRGASAFVIFGSAYVSATIMLFYSPEQGIALTMGTVLFFGLCVRPAPANLLVGLVGFMGAMTATWLIALRLGMVGNLLNAAGGVLDFPLLFSFQSLVLLLLLLVAGCAFVESFRNHSSQGQLVYLICVSLASAPAAFARADDGHIILNTLGALVAAMVILSQYPTIWRWTWLSFVLLIVLSTYGKYTLWKAVDDGTIMMQVHQAVFGRQDPSPKVAKVYSAVYKLTHRNAEARLEHLRAGLATPDVNAPQLPPHSHVFAPFGVLRRITAPPNGIQIVTGRSDGFIPLTDPSGIPEKIAEIEAHPDWPLLLPSSAPPLCALDYNSERSTLRKFLVTPYIPRPRHTVNEGKPFCDYIGAHYFVSSYASPVIGSAVWVRRSVGTK